jgi:phosphoglucomutase
VSFNEAHVLALTQAVCWYREAHGVAGPLFLGIDTHALSFPAYGTALEVLAANHVEVMLAEGDEFTPTPVLSQAILQYNCGRTHGLADGIMLTASHNPPEDGGFKYIPPHGGPAENRITTWLETQANKFLLGGMAGVLRIPHAQALHAATVHRYDFITGYVLELGNVVDMEAIREASLHLAVDPLGGAGVHYWARIADKYKLDLTVIDGSVDPTFRFMTMGSDGSVHMDPTSPDALGRLLAFRSLKDKFDLSFACDPDHDRHGIVAPTVGLMPSDHFLSAALHFLLTHRPEWSKTGAIGKTMVASAMFDRIANKLNRQVYETPVGFKSFTAGLKSGALLFAADESGGATFARRDGTIWTTDKDGIVPCLLAAEITARLDRDPGALYNSLTREFGEPVGDKLVVAASSDEKKLVGALAAEQFIATQLAGEHVLSVLSRAPSDHSPFGGLRVVSDSGWFAVRSSRTEPAYKIYAESFRGPGHLRRILAEAQGFVRGVLQGGASAQASSTMAETARLRGQIEADAVLIWQHGGGAP